MSEESRAVEYRRQMTARAQAECDRAFVLFPGSSTAAAAVRVAWGPVTDPVSGWDPPVFCPARGGIQVG